MKKSLKYGIGIASIIAAASLGDMTDLNDRLYYPLIYRNTPLRENTYGNPFSIRKRYVLNNGFLEVQIGDEETNQYYSVTSELRVNERPLQEQLIDVTGNVIDTIQRRTNSFVGKLKNIYNEYRGRE